MVLRSVVERDHMPADVSNVAWSSVAEETFSRGLLERNSSRAFRYELGHGIVAEPGWRCSRVLQYCARGQVTSHAIASGGPCDSPKNTNMLDVSMSQAATTSTSDTVGRQGRLSSAGQASYGSLAIGPRLTSVCMVLQCCACGTSGYAPDERVTSTSAGVVLGSNDFVLVAEDGENVPRRYRALLDAIGFLEPGGCTVGHVGNGVVVTAGHCLAPLSGPCSDYTVRWGYRVNSEGTVSLCERIIT